MVTITELKFLYSDKKYAIECVDFIAELRVKNTQYDTIVNAIKGKYRDIDNIRVLSYKLK